MSKLTLPLATMPSAIAESIAVTLRAHGLTFSPELLREIGNNTTQALLALDEGPEGSVHGPSLADRLLVGQTLRALAATGRLDVANAAALERVGGWLTDAALADLAGAEKGGKAA